MSRELYEALTAWNQACHECAPRAERLPPAPPPAERKKSDDTEGGTCD